MLARRYCCDLPCKIVPHCQLIDHQAKLVLRKALKLNPKNTAAAAALSDVLCKENALDEACTWYIHFS